MIDGRVLRALELTDGDYYSINKALSYDRPAIIQLGPRGGGKSTTDARLVLFDYIYNKHQWLYIRRQRDELDTTKKKFFDDAIDIINNAVDDKGGHLFPFYIPYFMCESSHYNIVVRYYNIDYDTDLYDKDGNKVDEDPKDREKRLEKELKDEAEECGLAQALNMSQKVKSGFFTNSDIWWFIYDEFIAEHQTGYLGSKDTSNMEYQNLMSMYISADRGVGRFFRNEVKILLIGNLANISNPILIAWGINRYYASAQDPHFIAPKDKGWVLEVIKPSNSYIQSAMKSNVWKLLTDEEREYNIGNKPRSGEYGNKFICANVPKDGVYISGMVLQGEKYGVYYNRHNGDIYINKFRDKGKCEALDLYSFSGGNDMLLCQSWNKSPLLTAIHDNFLREKLYFGNRHTQLIFLQYLDFIPR